jgi:hypothetical protein
MIAELPYDKIWRNNQIVFLSIPHLPYMNVKKLMMWKDFYLFYKVFLIQ